MHWVEIPGDVQYGDGGKSAKQDRKVKSIIVVVGLDLDPLGRGIGRLHIIGYTCE